jgi:predicted dehydrogenase
MTARVRIGQIGTRHGHALGKWRALHANPRIEAVGIWEPDPARRAIEAFEPARWFDSADDLLADASVLAVAIEGRNHESLGMAQAAVAAGKHLWFDKPAGDNWPAFEHLLQSAERRGVYIQMGYMFRYSPGFTRVVDMARSGELGDVFAIRGHMSTNIDLVERTEERRHRGGILYDLGSHMLDQIVWLLGRPLRVHTVLRNDHTPEVPAFCDNTVAVLEFERALAIVDIAAMEPTPTARRFEVYGTRGSAIIEPFDPVRTLRLARHGESEAEILEIAEVPRQALYERELEGLVHVVADGGAPDRPLAHERLVQETLLRVTGRIT